MREMKVALLLYKTGLGNEVGVDVCYLCTTGRVEIILLSVFLFLLNDFLFVLLFL